MADTPIDTPLASGATTPLLLEPEARQKSGGKKQGGSRVPRAPSPKKQIITYDSDIEPEDLVPAYLETKTKLFNLQRPQQETPKKKGKKPASQLDVDAIAEISPDDIEIAKLLAKVDRIVKDPLFDKDLADMQWQPARIALEKDYAALKKEKAEAETKAQQAAVAENSVDEAKDSSDDSDDDITKEAERMAAEILAQDDDEEDAALADLFASLPVNEVDPTTGKSTTVINSADGEKVTIRDFGKWTGVSPRRVLEEACRARYVFETLLC